MLEMTTVAASSITKENWEEKKRKLIEKYPQLINEELMYEDGKTEELVDFIHSKIGKAIGKTKKQLHKLIEYI